MYGYVISIEVSVIFNEKIILLRKNSKFSKWRVLGVLLVWILLWVLVLGFFNAHVLFYI